MTEAQSEELVAVYRNTSNGHAGGCSWQDGHALALEAVARYAIEHADRLGLAPVAPHEAVTVLGTLTKHMILLADLVQTLETRTATLERASLAQRLAILEATLDQLGLGAARGALKTDVVGLVAIKES